MNKKKKNSYKKDTTPKSSFVATVFEVFVNNPYRALNFRQISSQLGLSDKASKELVKVILEDLRKNKSIVELNRGKYQLAPEKFKEAIPKNMLQV